MSGHSGFVPVGNHIPAVNPPQVGGADNRANPPANGPGSAPQGQPANAPANPPNARSLAQKLDVMLLEAAKLSTRSVDAKSIQQATQLPGLGKAERKALAAAAEKAQRTMKAIARYTGRQIAAAFSADGNGVFQWSTDPAAKAIRDAIDAQAALGERLHALANRPEAAGEAFDAVLDLALQCDRRQTEITTLALELADALSNANDPAVAKRLDARLVTLLPRQARSNGSGGRENRVPMFGKWGKTGFQSLGKRRNRLPMFGKTRRAGIESHGNRFADIEKRQGDGRWRSGGEAGGKSAGKMAGRGNLGLRGGAGDGKMG